MSVDRLLHISCSMNDIIQVFKFLKSMLMLIFQYDECLCIFRLFPYVGKLDPPILV